MAAWWGRLSPLNQAFYALAIFFSTLFAWQFWASVSGLGGEEGDADAGVEVAEGDADTGADGGDLAEDAAGLATLRLLSIRSILAFGLLFSWAGALYLQTNTSQTWVLVRAALWGLAGMIVVALFFWVLPRLSEEGTASLDTAVGSVGQVYLNIPEDGVGQVKVMVSGAVRFVPARARSGQPLPAGTMVRIVQRLDATALEVEEVEA